MHIPRFIYSLSPRYNRLARIIWGFLAMVIIAYGIHLEVLADIGLSPWDALNQGISRTFPKISMGTASVSIGAAIIIVDLLMKEKIGFCTLLDTFCIGNILDFFNYIDPVIIFDNTVFRIVLFIIALSIFAIGLYFYMSCALSCGPRDTLTVALGKKFRKVSIGTITTIMYMCVLVTALLLGATLGVGTILALTFAGMLIDFFFGLFHFEARDVKHEDFITTIKVIITNKEN